MYGKGYKVGFSKTHRAYLDQNAPTSLLTLTLPAFISHGHHSSQYFYFPMWENMQYVYFCNWLISFHQYNHCAINYRVSFFACIINYSCVYLNVCIHIHGSYFLYVVICYWHLAQEGTDRFLIALNTIY